MKKAIIIAICLFLLGCSKVTPIEEHATMTDEPYKIVVKKLIGAQYEIIREIKNESQVKLVMEALDATYWKNARVSMIREEDYRFYFQSLKPNVKAETVLYGVWVTPNQKQLQIIQFGMDQYAKLNEENSAVIHGVLTGENLGEN